MSFDVVVLISGNGSNLQALIDAEKAGAPFHISAVISNRPNAYGLQRAEQAGIPHHIIDHTEYDNRASFDQELINRIQQYKPSLIVLAGFMRKLTPGFIQAFPNRIINIHPSLLPKYPGLHTHQRALDAGDAEHGVSIHVVTEDLDSGPLLAQLKCPIEVDDNADNLKSKVQVLEHQLYPQVVSGIALGEIAISF
ncbi:MAG: phosphoribosylglycinamide formyltransferase [Coxiellaceae bacterium]|nr:phosphoribosylglycinamide formyltransferase [Coxiellaceae bacterium]